MNKLPGLSAVCGVILILASGSVLAQDHGRGHGHDKDRHGHDGGRDKGQERDPDRYVQHRDYRDHRNDHGRYKNWHDRGRHEGWYKRGGYLPVG